MADSELREVYSAANTPEAHLVKAALENAGIEARVVGDKLQSAIGVLPAGAIAPRVWVRTENFEKARKIVVECEANRQASATPTGEWKCVKCGQPNASSFEICWNCQAVRGSGE